MTTSVLLTPTYLELQSQSVLTNPEDFQNEVRKALARRGPRREIYHDKGRFIKYALEEIGQLQIMKRDEAYDLFSGLSLYQSNGADPSEAFKRFMTRNVSRLGRQPQD
ncbi:MAG: hypothetical protein D6698_10625 [Gammaproteobacteria bacterium]|nr:MAG: hypothetical protein D6698_10625 [Gammaproteobacteria bacterium]